MGEYIVVTGRLGSSPRARGSATGQTCPDFLELEGDLVGVIGETPSAELSREIPGGLEQSPDQGYLVVPSALVFDALASGLRS